MESEQFADHHANIVGIFTPSNVIVTALAEPWQRMYRGETNVPDELVGLYLEAAWLFHQGNTALVDEAIEALGESFLPEKYTLLEQLEPQTEMQKRAHIAILMLHDEFGNALPSALYKLLWEIATKANKAGYYRLFEGENATEEDLIADAVLHGFLLVTPLSKRLHHIFEQNGLEFDHLMDCGCIYALSRFNRPNAYKIEMDKRDAYLQNMVRASLEQYGTNARTMGSLRGF